MILINNDKQTLEFDSIGYEFPDYEPLEEEYDYDANWLVIEFNYQEKDYNRKLIGPYLMTFEIIELINDLSRLYNNKTKKVESRFIETYFKIEVKANKDNFTMYVKLNDFEKRKKYEIKKDITLEELDELITNLEIISLKYPERA